MISIESTTMRNVKRWRDAKMIERWTAAGTLEAEKRFYRAQGHRDIPALKAALRSCLGERALSEPAPFGVSLGDSIVYSRP